MRVVVVGAGREPRRMELPEHRASGGGRGSRNPAEVSEARGQFADVRSRGIDKDDWEGERGREAGGAGARLETKPGETRLGEFRHKGGFFWTMPFLATDNDDVYVLYYSYSFMRRSVRCG